MGRLAFVISPAPDPVRMFEQLIDPTLPANTGFLLVKDVAGVTELFYSDPDTGGSPIQMTAGSGLNSAAISLALTDLTDVTAKTGTGTIVVMDTLPTLDDLTIARDQGVNDWIFQGEAAGEPVFSSLLGGTRVFGVRSDGTLQLGVRGMRSDGAEILYSPPAEANRIRRGVNTFIKFGSNGPDGDLSFESNRVDGATNIGMTFNQNTAMSTAGAKLFEWQEAGVAVLSILHDATLESARIVHSTVGGFKFPDNSIQVTAAVTFVHPDPHRLGDGIASAPTYSFASSTNSGMLFGIGRVRFSLTGTVRMEITSSEITLTGAVRSTDSFTLNTGGAPATPVYRIRVGGGTAAGIFGPGPDIIAISTSGFERFRVLAASNTIQFLAGGTVQGGSGVHTLTLSGGAGAASSIAIGASDEKIGMYGVAAVVRGVALTAEDATVIDATYDAVEEAVLNNVRTRVGELESRLQGLGAIN